MTQYVPTTAEIIQIVCEEYSMDPMLLRGKTRARRVTRARHVAMYLLRKYTEQSLDQIGLLFSRDHSTVIWAVARVKRLKETDSSLRELLASMCSSLEEEHHDGTEGGDLDPLTPRNLGY